MLAHEDVGALPEFKLRRPVADDSASPNVVAEATLCGYMARNSVGSLWHRCSPARFYRLVYRRRGRNGGSGGTPLPPATTAPPRNRNDKVIVGTVIAEQEERRLMATEEGRRRYDLR